MSDKSLSKNVYRLSAACMAIVALTAGCVKRPPSSTSNNQGAGTTTSTTATPSNSLVTPVNPPFPGPYKEVELDGVQMRQSRFPQGKYGGHIVQALIASDPKTFNPWASNDSTSSSLASLMWGALLTTDPFTGDVITDMAESYEVKPDHVTYIIKLRKGLKWSDGKPITAEDVAYTFNTIVAGGYGNASIKDSISVGGQPPKVTVLDELTTQFVTAKPFAPFLRSVGVPIAPKHVFEPITSAKDGQKKFNGVYSPSGIDPTKMVTSGPFRLTRFVPSQRVEFERAPNYYVADPSGQKRLPYVDRLVYLFVPKVETNLLKFKAGELDLAGIRSKDAVQLQKESAAGNFKLYNLGPSTGTTFLMFNMNRRSKNGKPHVTPYKAAWFNDVNFRQAINHAIRRQSIIDGYLKGIGTPSFAAESTNSPFFNTNLKPIEQNLDYSMELLKKSGFMKKDDGNLYDKDGHKVEFDMLAGAGGTFMEAMAGYIQSDLKKLGIKANYQEVEFNSLIDKVTNTKDWQACLFSLTGDPLEPNGGANVFRSDGRLHLFDIRELGPNGKAIVNDVRPWEKEIDTLFDQGAVEFDTDKRKDVYGKFQQIIYDQAPFIYLVNSMNLVGARNTIKNYAPTQMAPSQHTMGLHNLDEVYKED